MHKPTPEDVEQQQAAFLEAYDSQAVDLRTYDSEEIRKPSRIEVPSKLNRAEKRANMNRLRALRHRATRERDAECKAFGIPTPAGPISAWIKSSIRQGWQDGQKGLRP